MGESGIGLFLVVVFATVFLTSQLLMVPTFGTSKKEIDRLRSRLQSLEAEGEGGDVNLLLRERFRRKASSLERWTSWIPGVNAFLRNMEVRGLQSKSHGYLIASILSSILGGLIGWFVVANISIHPS